MVLVLTHGAGRLSHHARHREWEEDVRTPLPCQRYSVCCPVGLLLFRLDRKGGSYVFVEEVNCLLVSRIYSYSVCREEGQTGNNPARQQKMPPSSCPASFDGSRGVCHVPRVSVGRSLNIFLAPFGGRRNDLSWLVASPRCPRNKCRASSRGLAKREGPHRVTAIFGGTLYNSFEYYVCMLRTQFVSSFLVFFGAQRCLGCSLHC